MSFFSSKRERRLWLALLVVLLAIYATLGKAPDIVAALGESALNSAGNNLVAALLMLLVVIPVFFIRKRFGGAELAVGFGVLAVYLLAWLRLGSLEARTHLVEYSMVAALVHEALLERRENRRRVPAPALLALLISIGLGWLDESIQSALPNRVYDLVDVAFNTLAATMIITARQLLAWVRKRRSSQGEGDTARKP